MNSRSIIRETHAKYPHIPHQNPGEGGARMDSVATPYPSVTEGFDVAVRCFQEGVEAVDGPGMPRWKRSLDLVLIVASSPCWVVLMVIVTIWIKLASPGPIFYRQERVGFRRRRFMVIKFRSMRVNAETSSHEAYFEQLIQSDRPMTKLDAIGDPRVIPLGKLLRATGLDELPQIFNILRGEMSLVGPRPCTPVEFSRYESRHRERVNAPPGLTGYWQVNGKNRTTFNEMIAMDIYYREHMSFRLDCMIIAKTLPAIIAQMLHTRSINSARKESGKPEMGAEKS